MILCVRFIEKKIALSSISKHVFKEKTLMQDYNLAKKSKLICFRIV